MNIIGERIRTARRERGLSQESLAKAIGVTKATISRYENGDREPRLDQICDLADALDVTSGYLQGDENSIDSKKLLDALEKSDLRTVERLMGLPEGSIRELSPEEEAEVEKKYREKRRTSEMILNRIRLYLKFHYNGSLTEQDYLSIKALIDRFSALNEDGQQKAIERVEELTEIPKYQRQEQPPEAPQDPPEDT